MKKKGFTLIELLAVIVVLTIITVITVPIVLNIIENASEGAAIASARNYIKTVETYVVSSELNKKNTLLKNNKYNINKAITIDGKTYQAINNLIDIKGIKPSGSEDYVTLGDSYSMVEAKLTINGYEIFLKNDKVVSIIKNGNVIKESLLSDVVNVGDYVAYDAGEWAETKTQPTSQGEFGGYAKGSKANSVTCSSSTSLKGWRVLSVNNKTNTVTIIHAGQPECYYHGTNNSSSGVTNLNNRVASTYLNSNYATSAHNMNYDEANAIVEYNNLRTTGGYYWLASSYDTNYMWLMYGNGSILRHNGGDGFGVRPVVVLKSNIKTTGKTTDAVGQEAWSLVAP